MLNAISAYFLITIKIKATKRKDQTDAHKNRDWKAKLSSHDTFTFIAILLLFFPSQTPSSGRFICSSSFHYFTFSLSLPHSFSEKFGIIISWISP